MIHCCVEEVEWNRTGKVSFVVLGEWLIVVIAII